MKTISILGSTGSIGCSALEVIRLHPEKFDIFAIYNCKFKPISIPLKIDENILTASIIKEKKDITKEYT